MKKLSTLFAGILAIGAVSGTALADEPTQVDTTAPAVHAHKHRGHHHGHFHGSHKKGEQAAATAKGQFDSKKADVENRAAATAQSGESAAQSAESAATAQ